MAKEQYNTRLDDDLAGQVQAYRQARGLSKSEAVRELIDEGLQQYRTTESPDDNSSSESDGPQHGSVGSRTLHIQGLIRLALPIFFVIGLAILWHMGLIQAVVNA